MDEKRKEEMEEMYNEYKDIVEFTSKEDVKGPADRYEKIRFFTDLYHKKQLNELTKRLSWATFLLFGVTALQLYRELSGPEATKSLLSNITIVGIYLVLIYGLLNMLSSTWKFLKDKMWNNKGYIFNLIKNNIQNRFTFLPYIKHLIIGLIIMLLIPPYLSLFSTNMHEKAHLEKYEKYGICGDYKSNIITAIPNFYGRLLKLNVELGKAIVNDISF